jgi:hypothetical protein
LRFFRLAQIRSMFAAATTLVHVSISATRRALNSPGVEGRGSLPSLLSWRRHCCQHRASGQQRQALSFQTRAPHSARRTVHAGSGSSSETPRRKRLFSSGTMESGSFSRPRQGMRIRRGSAGSYGGCSRPLGRRERTNASPQSCPQPLRSRRESRSRAYRISQSSVLSCLSRLYSLRARVNARRKMGNPSQAVLSCQRPSVQGPGPVVNRRPSWTPADITLNH